MEYNKVYNIYYSYSQWIFSVLSSAQGHSILRQRQTGRQTGRQADRETERQTERQTESTEYFPEIPTGDKRKRKPCFAGTYSGTQTTRAKHRLVTIEETTTNQTAALNSSCTNFGLFSPEHLSDGRLAHDARSVRVVHVEHGLQLVLTGP